MPLEVKQSTLHQLASRKRCGPFARKLTLMRCLRLYSSSVRVNAVDVLDRPSANSSSVVVMCSLDK